MMTKSRIIGSIVLLTFALIVFRTKREEVLSVRMVEKQQFQSESEEYPSFNEWKNRFGKHYNTQQQTLFRQAIYLRNLIAIRNHNLRFMQNLTRYTQAPNHLADLTDDEFTHLYNWPNSPAISELSLRDTCTGSIMDSPNPPLELDWDNKVTAVSDQGTCGKDWAIVASGAIESLYAIKVGQLPVLSVQQLLECSGEYGNQGCNGGFMDQAFYYVIDNGIATAKTYPERQITKCKYVLNMKFTAFKQCARIPSGNHSKLISAVIQQPVSVALDFSQEMKFYKGGVYDGACTTKLTHAMLLTGYGGKQHGTHFWKLRNTLGASWGAKGYIDLLRDDKDGAGNCGIQLWPSVPQSIV